MCSSSCVVVVELLTRVEDEGLEGFGSEGMLCGVVASAKVSESKLPSSVRDRGWCHCGCLCVVSRGKEMGTLAVEGLSSSSGSLSSPL